MKKNIILKFHKKEFQMKALNNTSPINNIKMGILLENMDLHILSNYI